MSIPIPDSVTSIRYGAFEGCSSLSSITIPGGVTSIGDWAFQGCIKLVSLIFKGKTTAEVKSTFTNYTNWGISEDKIHGELDT